MKPSMWPIRTPLRPTEQSPPRSRVADLPSSEAEMSDPLEGSGSTLERGGDGPVGLRGVRMGHMLGFSESFPLFRIWKEAESLRGPSCLNMCLCF